MVIAPHWPKKPWSSPHIGPRSLGSSTSRTCPPSPWTCPPATTSCLRNDNRDTRGSGLPYVASRPSYFRSALDVVEKRPLALRGPPNAGTTSHGAGSTCMHPTPLEQPGATVHPSSTKQEEGHGAFVNHLGPNNCDRRGRARTTRHLPFPIRPNYGHAEELRLQACLLLQVLRLLSLQPARREPHRHRTLQRVARPEGHGGRQ